MWTPKKRLDLETETVSELTEEQLGNIAGGVNMTGEPRSLLSNITESKTGTVTSETSMTSPTSRDSLSGETGGAL